MSADRIPSGPEAYARAAELLGSGGLVAFPTETVYGLAGDARSPDAIEAIYRAKGRPSHNPLITHLLTPECAGRYATIPDMATTLIARFWPGPLTLVLPRRESELAERASAGLDTLALRCPDADWRHGLLQAGWTAPLVMPSANRSGHVSPTTADHVMEDLGDRIDLVIDGGACGLGLESTVVAIEGETATLLRAGAIGTSDIVRITGPLAQATAIQPIASPGMLDKHYAPGAPLRINVETAAEGETLIGFGPDYPAPNLSPSGDLNEAAKNLYAMLRANDVPGAALAIAPIPTNGIGAAINDRLRRASLGR